MEFTVGFLLLKLLWHQGEDVYTGLFELHLGVLRSSKRDGARGERGLHDQDRGFRIQVCS